MENASNEVSTILKRLGNLLLPIFRVPWSFSCYFSIARRLPYDSPRPENDEMVLSDEFLFAAGVMSALLGITALVGSGYGLILIRLSLREVEESFRTAGESLFQFAVSLNKAAGAANNAAGSVDEAKRSLGIAARMAEDVASAVSNLGGITDLKILGVHPFRGFKVVLEDSRREFRSMADQLRNTSGSFGDDADNMREMAIDLKQSSDQMAELVAKLSGIAGGRGKTLLSGLERAIYLAVAWAALLGLFLLVLAAGLLTA